MLKNSREWTKSVDKRTHVADQKVSQERGFCIAFDPVHFSSPACADCNRVLIVVARAQGVFEPRVTPHIPELRFSRKVSFSKLSNFALVICIKITS
jgi:hypothetical protein